MVIWRICSAISLALSSLIWLTPCPASAQSEPADVPLIMFNPQGGANADRARVRKIFRAIKKRAASSAGRVTDLTRREFDAVRRMLARRGARSKRVHNTRSRLRALYAAIKRRAASASRRVLPLTKTEVWTVPKGEVQAVRKAAARRGVIMAEISQAWQQVFHSVRANLRMSPKQKSILSHAHASAAATSVGLVSASLPPMVEYALSKDEQLGGSARIVIRLNEKTALTLARTSLDIKSNMCIWRGTVVENGAPATIMWWPSGKIVGTVQYQGRIYSIRPLGNELHAVVEMAEDRMPREHAAMPVRVRASQSDPHADPLVQQGEASTLRRLVEVARPSRLRRLGAGKLRKLADRMKAWNQRPVAGSFAPLTALFLPRKGKAAASSKNVVIDVMVAYTRKAAANYSDIKRDLIDLAIEEANESFRISNLGQVRLRLVHTYQTDYKEQGEHFEHLYRMVDRGDGYMDEVHGLRDKYRADVVVLVVDDPAGCGLTTRVGADADEAFAVVHHECAASSYSIAHEIGHIIGARHDLQVDKTMTPFPYGHGYVNGTKWRDIMSYKESCNGCPRVPVWSSPNVFVKGEPAGTSALDNARVIMEQAARVAAFR